MSQSVARQPIPVGKYFLERRKITQEQLDLALKHRSEFGLKLGQSLVELGFVTEAEMVEALKHQARFPCIHLTSGIVDARIAHKLGEEESRRMRALVLNQIAGHSTVAMEDPSDALALDELAHLLATRIFPVYAEPSAIAALTDQIFGKTRRTAFQPRPAEVGAQRPSAPPAPVPAAPAPHEVEDAPPDERAVVERLRAFLVQAFEQSVSDIHLEARRDALLVRFRTGGRLREHARLPARWTAQTLACLKSLAKLESKANGPQEGRIPFLFKKEELSVRVATTPSLHGESAVLHVRRGERPHRTLAELGLAGPQLEQAQEILSAPRGLVLVAAPAGGGLTTTLHALLERLATGDRKVAALEEQIEHEFEGVLQVTLDRRTGLGYAGTARALLLQDPDLLLLSQVDGRETAECALEAALDGRLVVAGVRARGACEAIARFGLEPYLVADALQGVIAQSLVRRICPECKAPIVPDEVLRTRLGLAQDGATYQEGEGCTDCQRTGYRGQLALFEVLGVEPDLRRAIEKGEDAHGLARAARFTSLREQGLRLARAGETTLHEVLSATPRP